MNFLNAHQLHRQSVVLLSGIMLAVISGCATPPPAPVTPQQAVTPPPPAPPAPTAAETAAAREKQIVDARQRQLSQDWPNLKRYQADNAKTGQPTEGENRVVFMGDSITDFWIRLAPDFFAGKPYLDRGISGQTTPQMLLRFRQDVIDLNPKVVVILAGTNDIAGNTGLATPKMIEDNLQSMVELARANGIHPILASILPASKFPWNPDLEPGPQIAALNAWIKDYAGRHHLVYLDYYSAMVNEHLGLPANLSKDGVHPNEAGYAIMGALAEKAIAQAMDQEASRTPR